MRSPSTPHAARTPAEILAQLEEHPRRLTDVAAGLTRERLDDVSCLGTWSANDVLVHLRCCAEAGAAAVRGLARADDSVVHFVGPRTLIERVDYRDHDFTENLGALKRQRPGLLKLLRGIPRGRWSREGRTSDGGPARDRTILDYGQWLARHERRHVEQLERFARQRAPRSSGVTTRPARTPATAPAAAAPPMRGRAASRTTRRRAANRPT